MGIYQYGLLKPLRARGAEEHNAEWLGNRTLGIEVTEAGLAAQCCLGNIDPQHLGGNAEIAAIDVALTWPLPAAGSRLVTIRSDADAIGAMAVLALRAADNAPTSGMLERIALVSQADRFARGQWPGIRPMPVTASDIDEVGVGPQNLGAMIAGIGLPTTAIETAVSRMRQWLLSGAAPEDWIRIATKAADTLFTALRNGTVHLRDLDSGRIALVEGFVPGALRLGYRRAPVVIAVATLQTDPNQSPQRKITIAQHETGHADLETVARILSRTEPGWGGSATIIGSPQGKNCITSVIHCTDILQKQMMRR